LGRSQVLSMMIPLLILRNKLEKSIAGSLDMTGKAPDSEKRALLSKVTMLLRNKLYKVRRGRHQHGEAPEDDTNKMEDSDDRLGRVAQTVINLARKADKWEQKKCCSEGLLLICRYLYDDDDDNIPKSISDLYQTAVVEWSTKRTTRLETFLWEDIIQQLPPSMGQILLTEPLCKALVDARSPFLKSEAFRLLANIVPTEKDRGENDNVKMSALGLETVKRAFGNVLVGFVEALKTQEMKKAKRLRTVLATTKKWIGFAADSNTPILHLEPPVVEKAQIAAELLTTLEKEDETSGHLQQNVAELRSQIAAYLVRVEASMKQERPTTSTGKSKKSKKKKKGRKK